MPAWAGFFDALVADGRAIVLACPEWAGNIALGVSLRAPSLDPAKWFECRFDVVEEPGWLAGERVRLRRNGVAHGFLSERTRLPVGMTAERWQSQQVDAMLHAHRGSTLVSRTAAPVLNQFDGEVATMSWHDGTGPRLTKRGVAVHEGLGYLVSISLPFSEQSLFAPLARQARLHPGEVAALSQ